MKVLSLTRLYPWAAVVIAAICMALVGLNIAGGLFNGLLQIAGLCVFVAVLQKKSTHTFFMAWLFASVWLCVSVWWLYIALHDIGGMPGWIAILAIALLCGGLATYYALSITLYLYSQKSVKPLLRPVLFAACWTCAELARAQWFTGFPWSAIGYSHVNSLLSYAAPWVGVYGIGFISAMLACWVGIKIPLSPQKLTSKILFCSVLVVVCLPTMRQKENTERGLSVNLLQANISQLAKFNTARQEALEWYADQAMQSTADLTVMPEIAIPYFKEELPPGYWQTLEGKFSSGKQIALLGMPTLDKEKGYGNSAIGLGFGDDQTYDKHHLVPFGEFTPESLKWFTRLMVNDLGDFNRGSKTQSPFVWHGHRLSVTICYEDLFGEDLAARFNRADQAPTLFVNISNIAWFGDTMVVQQHLDIARMRSLEFETPTVRATNSGGTAVISAQGEILQQLPAYTRGTLFAQVPSQNALVTPFAIWAGHWGLMPVWILCLSVMAFALISRVRKNKHTATETASVK